ncbi:MAG: type II toxin-antitoxin system RelE family toxin [Thermoleophilaceae bacterium]
MGYTVELRPRAARAFRKLPRDVQARPLPTLRSLADDPRPVGAKALQGEPHGTLRVRVGHYRIIYRVDDRDHQAVVLDIAHRSTACRR